jgi:glutathione S-transferase
MTLVAIVAMLALVEYVVFVWLAGQARDNIAAPATTGHPDYERKFRVQENTIEQLVIFLPALYFFAQFVDPTAASALGLVFIVGRALYARAYIVGPANRGPGFLLTFGTNVILLVGGLVGALASLA